MIQRREHVRLASEPGDAIGIGGERFGQDRQRNVAIQFRVASAIDFAHAAGAEQRRDLIRPERATGFESQRAGL